ncbi:uncharacterized protein LTR77_001934 [Saxophila tyrrhenica]|uniref:Uncharacterized protein n=1 Tax=Saxophila tyrrhenica TaxID=1690608 RepID=A0AAV9PI10_9PEZI|nr:hypothetical protein LTR77_001934 [Saxophila tyrrhenica]
MSGFATIDRFLLYYQQAIFKSAQSFFSAKIPHPLNHHVGAMSKATIDPGSSVTGQHSAAEIEKQPTSKITSDTSLTDTTDSWSPLSNVSTFLPDHDQTGLPAQRTRNSSRPLSRPWKPTLFRAGPLSGILAMLVALTSIVVSLAILVASDGAAVSSWEAQPSIYLAICTAVANLAMRYACLQGVVIAWWTRAFKGSITLGKLHHDWRSGSTLKGAILAGRHLGLLSLATIFSTVVVVDGPLLQQSSAVKSASFDSVPLPLEIMIAQQIPRGYSGYWARGEDLGFDQTPYNEQFNTTMPGPNGTEVSNTLFVTETDQFEQTIGRPYLADDGIPGITSGCKGRCRATINAPAFALTECTSHQLPVDYHQSVGFLKSQALNIAPPLNQELFFVAEVLITEPGGLETVTILTGYSKTRNCVGTLNYTSCSLRSATARYNVTIEQDRITLINPAHPRIIAYANNSLTNGTVIPRLSGYSSTLGGIVTIDQKAWASMVAAFIEHSRLSFQRFTNGQDVNYLLPGDDTCRSYNDPWEDALASLNKLMVYVGAAAGQENMAFLEARMDPGVAARTKTSVTAYQIGEHNVFRTDYKWFVAAAIVELVCICLVAPTYWGWWRLGRSVSFSPLEIAKAFEAPMLAGCHWNSSGRDAARAVGDVRVQYGFTGPLPGPESTKLAFMHPAPQAGSDTCHETATEKQM